MAAAQGRERGSIMLGEFITDRDSRGRLDSAAGSGTDLDLEDDLGFESSMNVARLGGYFWFNPRHRFDVSVFDLSRESSKRIEETIEFGDRTFAIDTVVTATNDMTIGKLDYTFAALNRERGYLGINGGLYVASFGLAISEPTLGTAESKDVTAPLPVIGLRGDYAIGEHVTLRGAAQWFGMHARDFEGTLRDVYFGADYGFGERMAVGVAYNYASMNIDVHKRAEFEGNIDWGYDGIMLYLKFDFGR